MIGTQSRSYSHGVPKVDTFTHHNKLTSRIVSKLLIGLTTLNQALICTPTPNLIGVIQSKYHKWSLTICDRCFGYYKEFKNVKLDK